MKLQKIVFFSFVILLFSACTGTRNVGNSNKHVHLFYTDIGAVQYFIKPLAYESETNFEASVDFTLRDTVEKPQARMVFSIYSENPVKGHSECKLSLNDKETIEARKLFAEPTKKGYVYRYESIIQYEVLVDIIRNQTSFQVKIGEQNIKFSPTKKTLKTLPDVDRKTISMIESR